MGSFFLVQKKQKIYQDSKMNSEDEIFRLENNISCQLIDCLYFII